MWDALATMESELDKKVPMGFASDDFSDLRNELLKQVAVQNSSNPTDAPEEPPQDKRPTVTLSYEQESFTVSEPEPSSPTGGNLQLPPDVTADEINQKLIEHIETLHQVIEDQKHSLQMVQEDNTELRKQLKKHQEGRPTPAFQSLAGNPTPLKPKNSHADSSTSSRAHPDDDLAIDFSDYLRDRVIHLENMVADLNKVVSGQEDTISKQAAELQQAREETNMQIEINDMLTEQVELLQCTDEHKQSIIETQRATLRMVRQADTSRGSSPVPTTNVLSLSALQELLSDRIEPVVSRVQVLIKTNMQTALKPDEHTAIHNQILLDPFVGLEVKKALLDGLGFCSTYDCLTPETKIIKDKILASQEPVQSKLSFLQSAAVWKYCTMEDRHNIKTSLLEVHYLDVNKKRELCTRYGIPLINEAEITLKKSITVHTQAARTQLLDEVTSTQLLGFAQKVELLLQAKEEWLLYDYQQLRTNLELSFMELGGKAKD
eukprot:TRINITY_DN45258_c0_g1_i1.p1 TRINITY_DN45258_c0_g1~~TRINITY_DN45258_c0_g1_i1.p1  ORF type:complete len:490 (-),score=54.89 TRINITY_DN45258_c0_g1_i1:96-1565(-)